MPEARLKQQPQGPENTANGLGAQQVPTASLMTALEQVCIAMSASGAVVAVRDEDGVRCIVSIADAPVVGSRLRPDSEFTKHCFETGEVVLCEDARNDPRIQPSVVESLQLRSAVAVPIYAQGSVIGVIEVFCSRPHAIYDSAITALKQVAESFAPSIDPDSWVPERPEIVAAPAVSQAQAVAESLPAKAVTDAQALSVAPVVELPRATTERAPASTLAFVDEAKRVVQLRDRLDPSLARPRIVRRFQTRYWWVAAALVLLLSLLFLFWITESRPRRTMTAIETTKTSAVSPASKDDGAPAQTAQRQPPAQGSLNGPGLQPPSPAGVVRSVTPPPSSKAAENVLSGSDTVHSVEPPAVRSEQGKSNSASSVNDREVAIARDAARSAEPGNSETSGPRAVALAPSKADAAVPPETTAAGVPGAVPPVAPLVKSAITSPPDFLLNRSFKGHANWVTGVVFSSDGRHLASGSWDQSIKFWDPLTGRELSGPSGDVKEVQALAISRDGRWLAAENSSDAVILWDVPTGREVRTLTSDKPLSAPGTNWVYSIAFSPDGRWLASAADDKTVRIWDVETGRAVRDLTALHRPVMYAAFSPDGRLLASGDGEKSIGIWEAATGLEIETLKGHKKLIYAVAFSPNGRLLASASGDRSIKIWDIDSGREVHTLTGHGNLVTSVSFSPDGRWLASGSWDKTIKIWNVATGREVQTLSGNEHSVYTVAFDSRGCQLASGSSDGTINLWVAPQCGDGELSKINSTPGSSGKSP
jgi:WD40 repeat protein